MKMIICKKSRKNIVLEAIVFISVVLIISNINISSYAMSKNLDDIIKAGDSFLEDGGTETAAFGDDGESELSNLSNFVSGVLLTVALGVTLISGVIMGMNFMFQSVEDKAKIKESMIPWVVGIFISFGAFGIWQITITIFDGF